MQNNNGSTPTLEELASELGVDVEVLKKNAHKLNKASGGFVKEVTKSLEAAEEAIIESEFQLGASIREAALGLISDHEEKNGPVQRGTQYLMFFTARKDGTNALVLKSKVKKAQSPKWIDQDGTISDEEPEGYKRERKSND